MEDVKAAISRIGSMEIDISNSNISITSRIEAALRVVAGLREAESASIKAQGINKRRCTTTNPSNSINFIPKQLTSHTMSRLCLLLITNSNNHTTAVAIAEKVIDNSSNTPTSNYQPTINTIKVTKTTFMKKLTVVISIRSGEEAVDRAK